MPNNPKPKKGTMAYYIKYQQKTVHKKIKALNLIPGAKPTPESSRALLDAIEIKPTPLKFGVTVDIRNAIIKELIYSLKQNMDYTEYAGEFAINPITIIRSCLETAPEHYPFTLQQFNYICQLIFAK